MASRQMGTVKFYREDKGYGFLSQPDGPDLFFHVKDCDCDGVTPMQGDFAEYVVAQGPRGPKATAVTITPAKD